MLVDCAVHGFNIFYQCYCNDDGDFDDGDDDESELGAGYYIGTDTEMKIRTLRFRGIAQPYDVDKKMERENSEK